MGHYITLLAFSGENQHRISSSSDRRQGRLHQLSCGSSGRDQRQPRDHLLQQQHLERLQGESDEVIASCKNHGLARNR